MADDTVCRVNNGIGGDGNSSQTLGYPVITGKEGINLCQKQGDKIPPSAGNAIISSASNFPLSSPQRKTSSPVNSDT